MARPILPAFSFSAVLLAALASSAVAAPKPSPLSLSDAEAIVRAECFGPYAKKKACGHCVYDEVKALKKQKLISGKMKKELKKLFRPECKDACVVTSCAIDEATCGTIDDECGGTLSCGGCGEGSSCQDNACVVDQPAGSCLDILRQSPGAASGVYTITVGGGPVQVYCDMVTQGGGWTLIQAHNAAINDTVEGQSVVPGSGTYLPGAIVQAVAMTSSAVRIDDGGTGAYGSVVSTTPYIIERLRDLLALNDDANAGVPGANWTGDLPALARLTYGCGTVGLAYPSVFWACGNGGGLHIEDGGNGDFVVRNHRWAFFGPQGSINIWVR